jgi:isopenicillin N synthase-like dioxygenase
MVSNKNRITKYKHIDFQEDAAKAFMELRDPEKETLSDTMRRIIKGYKKECLDQEEIQA